ncbi:mitofilin family membrane protein [Marinivivus vitaminiproducens]|uniref:mitofilin family membrane protein n=1 Tax=Marinivivus vitaminiproducens TaxID=3035935 RepID=UPI00279C5995|nr:mitofilin family membrane protein [Geminicoccaceae bacterium SCSIO 64248]
MSDKKSTRPGTSQPRPQEGKARSDVPDTRPSAAPAAKPTEVPPGLKPDTTSGQPAAKPAQAPSDAKSSAPVPPQQPASSKPTPSSASTTPPAGNGSRAGGSVPGSAASAKPATASPPPAAGTPRPATAASPEPRPVASQPAAKSGGSGFFGGFVGGIVATALAGAGLYYGVPPDTRAQFLIGDPISAVSGEVEALRSEIANAPAPTDPAAMQALQDQVEELAGQLAATTQRVDSLPTAAAPSGDAASPTAAPSEDPRVAELQQTVAQLNERLAAIPSGPQPVDPAFVGRVDELSGQVGQIGSRVDDLAGQVSGRFDDLSGQIGESRQLAGELQGRIAAVTDMTQAAQTGVTTLQQQVTEAGTRQRDAVLLAMANTGLRDAMASGAPFPGVVTTLQDVAGRDPAVGSAVEALVPVADSGVIERDALIAAYGEAESSALGAVQSGGSQDWIEQARGTLSSLVTVRSSGPQTGEGPQATLSRARESVDRGDLAAAIGEIETLQGPAADAMADWLADARGRLAAEQAAAALQDRTRALLAEAS